jgi:CheY-like chemotaxis protein
VRLLLVEDEAAIACRIRESLEKARYTVDWARDGVEALALAQEREYAAIILDLMLPGVDGWEVCETLRRRRDPTPILMLTARGALEDRIRGFEIGADDYLPKPFALPELRVRVRALIRRSAVHRTRLIRIDDLEIDTEARRVSRSGREIPLTRVCPGAGLERRRELFEHDRRPHPAAPSEGGRRPRRPPDPHGLRAGVRAPGARIGGGSSDRMTAVLPTASGHRCRRG